MNVEDILFMIGSGLLLLGIFILVFACAWCVVEK